MSGTKSIITCIDCAATAEDNDPIAPPEGWGWVRRSDSFSASGQGPFLACPLHRDDAPYWPKVAEMEAELAQLRATLEMIESLAGIC